MDKCFKKKFERKSNTVRTSEMAPVLCRAGLEEVLNTCGSSEESQQKRNWRREEEVK